MNIEKTKSWTFDKQYSKMIVGCGCILILMLHLWGNRAWKIDGNVCIAISLTQKLVVSSIEKWIK